MARRTKPCERCAGSLDTRGSRDAGESDRRCATCREELRHLHSAVEVAAAEAEVACADLDLALLREGK